MSQLFYLQICYDIKLFNAHSSNMNNSKSAIRVGRKLIILTIAVISILLVILMCVSENHYKAKVCVNTCKSKDEICELSAFSTTFATSGKNRAHNIILASSMLDNVTVKSGNTATFNSLVGARTYERGYLDANVIMKGVYVKGVGGGVCQVSSTMYNAWLLAGLDVVDSKAHTLPSSYVDLSRDATVSSEIDLVFANNTDSDVIIKVCTDGDVLNIAVHGKKRAYEYRLTTDIIAEIQSYLVPDVTIEVDSISDVGEVVYEGKSGYKSRLLIEVIEGGKVIAKRELRRDRYAPTPTQKVIKVLKGSVHN